MSSRCAWFGTLLLVAVGAAAQTSVTDPALFRRPLVFVPPQIPGVALAKHGGPLKYTVDVAISTDGTVAELLRLEPDHAEFRANLSQVTKFWLFFPSLDPATCRPILSKARVGMEFNGSGDDGTRTWLEYDPMLRVMNEKSPEVVTRPSTPPYPKDELHAGKYAKVYTVSVVDGQGKVTHAWTLLANAYSRGFVRTAERHAAAVSYDTNDRPTRCAVTLYDFKIRQ
jgi:hypothetical protein